MSENQGKDMIKKLTKKTKSNYKKVKKMFNRKRNRQNEDTQQHGNNEIKDDSSPDTDKSSNLQPNQPVEGNREIKHKNESIEEPGKKILKKEIGHGDDSS